MVAFLDWFERHKYGVVGTLLLHTVVMFILAVSAIRSNDRESDRSELSVEMVSVMSDDELTEAQRQLYLQQAVPGFQDVKTLVSNVTARPSDPSTRLSRTTREEIAENVEQDLKDLEQAEFDRLAEERRERGEEIVIPELDRSKWDPELYKDKAAEPVKVEGNAAVWHDLKDRLEERLDIPAYTCKGAGRVAVRVAVDRGGMVIKADLDSSQSTSSDDCMVERALASARMALFNRALNAPDPQRGTIYFLFVPQ